MLLTHYYHKNDEPFQTLSALSEAEALTVIGHLSKRPGKVYRRFSDPKSYLQARKETEQWVRRQFLSKGGRPNTLYPQYFVVGRSDWIEEGFSGNSRHYQMPVSALKSTSISFTYPDSMISYWLKTQTGKSFYHPNYHGQVFTLAEIQKTISKVGHPGRLWKTEEHRRYDLFIEAQVWLPAAAIMLTKECFSK